MRDRDYIRLVKINMGHQYHKQFMELLLSTSKAATNKVMQGSLFQDPGVLMKAACLLHQWANQIKSPFNITCHKPKFCDMNILIYKLKGTLPDRNR